MSKKYSDDPKYWDDFCKAQAAGAGYTGAVIYAGVRRMLRQAQAKKARRRIQR